MSIKVHKKSNETSFTLLPVGYSKFWGKGAAMTISQNNEELKAGTGFMMSLSEAVNSFVKKGYSSSFIPCEDHFENAKHIKILPEEFDVESVMRFENTSDPADSCILYAISVPKLGEKGLYIEPHGIYHDNLSEDLRNKLSTDRTHS